MGSKVSLRDYVASELQHERETRAAAFATRDEAVRLQAFEYSRRLEDLNHNLKMMLDERHMFLARDRHDQFVQEYHRFRDETNATQVTLRTWGAVGLLAMGIFNILLRIFF